MNNNTKDENDWNAISRKVEEVKNNLGIKKIVVQVYFIISLDCYYNVYCISPLLFPDIDCI